MLVSTREAGPVARPLPLLLLLLIFLPVFVQAAVVDQLPSMVSLVWALKRQGSQHLVVYSTALQWLFFTLNLNVGFVVSPPCFTWMRVCSTWRWFICVQSQFWLL